MTFCYSKKFFKLVKYNTWANFTPVMDARELFVIYLRTVNGKRRIASPITFRANELNFVAFGHILIRYKPTVCCVADRLIFHDQPVSSRHRDAVLGDKKARDGEDVGRTSSPASAAQQLQYPG